MRKSFNLAEIKLTILKNQNHQFFEKKFLQSRKRLKVSKESIIYVVL